MKQWLCLLVFACLASPHDVMADEFAKVKCGSDVPKAVIGQRSSNGPVVATEKKYAGLGLKDLGGDEIADRLSRVNRMICGAEYILLIDRGGLVRDAMAFPAHSKTSPAFSGICQLRGKDQPDIFIAVLDGAGSADLLPVQTAWKIDQKQRRFVKAPAEGLLCLRSGHFDRGRRALKRLAAGLTLFDHAAIKSKRRENAGLDEGRFIWGLRNEATCH